MSGIVIYVEGGGETGDGRAAIRRGLSDFLRDLRGAAWRKHWKWKVVPCGGRKSTFDAFMNAPATDPGFIALLLVDSEDPVTAQSPAGHLSSRDGWAFPEKTGGACFLMAQVMETWIVADPQALATFYGQRFNGNALPKHTDLEAVIKRDIERSLHNATYQTQKGTYHKIAHSEPLLRVIDISKVRKRCPNCEHFLSALEALLT